jgi:archaemetzincin
MLIRIIPMGKPPSLVLENLYKELKSVFISKTMIMTGIDVPGESYNHWRGQYNAERMMELLSKSPHVKFIDKKIPTLLVTDADVYHDKLNFIFGLEDPDLGCCLVSIARLRPEFYDYAPNLKVLSDRTVKEAIHEIGHHLGLNHCKHVFCIMSSSRSVEDIDAKRKSFCGGCRYELEKKGIRIE